MYLKMIVQIMQIAYLLQLSLIMEPESCLNGYQWHLGYEILPKTGQYMVL